MLKKLFGRKFGWTVPWAIVQDGQGSHYVPKNRHYQPEAGGTGTVLVEWQDDDLVARIHPDEMHEIETTDNLDGYRPVTIQIDKFMPSTKSVALNQTMDVISWLDQGNSELADLLIEINLGKFD